MERGRGKLWKYSNCVYVSPKDKKIKLKNKLELAEYDIMLFPINHVKNQ